MDKNSSNSIFVKLKAYYIYVLAILFLVASYYIYNWFNTESTDNAYVDADISLISSEVHGTIEEIFVQDNDVVEKNQVVALIDQVKYKSEYNQAEAEYNLSKTNIEILNQKIKNVQIECNKAKQSLDFAEVNNSITQKEFKRVIELGKEDFASKQVIDENKRRLEQAKNDLKQAKFNKEIIEQKLLILKFEQKAAEDKLKISENKLLIAKEELYNTEIKSPIKGILTNNVMRKGNYLRPGSVLFSVVPDHDNTNYIKANFKETQVKKFRPGMEVDILFDAFSSVKVKGKIRSITPATSAKFSIVQSMNATGNFTKVVQRVPVLIDFDLPENFYGNVVPGMSALVKIKTN